MPKGSDATFAAKLQQHHAGHPRFSTPARAADAGGFTVHHYAGPVPYSASKFLDKNRDTLSKGVCRQRCRGWRAGRCSRLVQRACIAAPLQRPQRAHLLLLACPPLADLVALLQASDAPMVQVLAAEMERGQERRGSQTVGSRFRDQLRDLIARLDA